MELKDIITLVIAVVGAVLGLMNTWRAMSQDRLRLVVKPQHAIFASGPPRLGILVINRSNFPVTITHMGFKLHGTSSHMQFVPEFPGGQSLPIRLEPRTNFTAFLRAGAEKTQNFHLVKTAYVGTACGNTVEGRTGALDSFVKNESLARLQQPY